MRTPPARAPLPVGRSVVDWRPRERPRHGRFEGRWCTLQPLDADDHADELHAAFAADDGSMWTYMGYGPFASATDYRTWARSWHDDRETLFFAIIDATGRPGGVTSLCRIDPTHGRAEIGHIAIAPRLQRTAASTEAAWLLINHVFELGYRRCEWKCDAHNEASKRAALRLGFVHEGTFASDRIVKGRNRDTAWFAITADRWPALDNALRKWLADDNFDDRGGQKASLVALRGERPVPIPADRVHVQTDRLLLRIPHPNEAAAMVDYYDRNRAHLQPFEPRRDDAFYRPETWRKKLVAARDEWLHRRSLRLAIYAKQRPERVIGVVNFTGVMGGSMKQCFVGYALDAEAQGRGLMTEALQAAVPFAADQLDLHRISANYMPDNVRSGRVLERLGFVQEGHAAAYLRLDGGWRDHVLTARIFP